MSPARPPSSPSQSHAPNWLRSRVLRWGLPTIAVLVLVGWQVQRQIELATKQQLATGLQTLLEADLAALRMWLQTRELAAESFTIDPLITPAIEAQIVLAEEAEADALRLVHSEHHQEIRGVMSVYLNMLGFNGYAIVDRERRIIAASADEVVGKTAFQPWQAMLEKAFAGELTVSKPFPSAMLVADDSGDLAAGRPTMLSAAPFLGADGEVAAVVALRFSPENDFTRLLRLARSGESGETYAFDAEGLLVSESRFDEHLKRVGLLPAVDGTRAIMNVEIRDPGVNLVAGEQTTVPRADQPLTRMAASAVQGQSGVDVDGYRDYRGVPVIGAWAWLPEYGFGVTTEVDVEEAFRPLVILRIAFGVLFGLLVLVTLATLVFIRVNERLQLSARRAALKAKKLGQYQLDTKIGEGGMGVVYRAHHALMQRPTAVKMLREDLTSKTNAARFEREVKLCSQLNHPNTVAVYDFGRTPEGVFYYAMEYLDGITLQQLVEKHGRQPAARVAAILSQVCGSLAEAHGVGLIHRDIKPANIMLNRRGGLFDIVKVLDFGLAKPTGTPRELQLTQEGALAGTPLYLAPEVIQTPSRADARSDLYAVGAVGYFLLTGRPVFEGDSAVEVCMKHVKEPPRPPSEVLAAAVSGGLEEVLLRSLAKDPAERHQNAERLMAALEGCREGSWGADDARDWWSKHYAMDGVRANKTPEAVRPHDETVVHTPRV